MALPLPSLILLSLAAFGTAVLVLGLVGLWRIKRTVLPPVERYPSFSLIKPLAGLDDELQENLESHLNLDYPGEYEILLGVRSEKDAAYPVAKAFADAHPERVRLVLQQGEPGHNPKVNQLITLTREARHELIASTDSNVRVHPTLLREHAALLLDPRVGLTSHTFTGVGEQRLGALLDNMTLCSFCATNIAAANALFGLDQIVGKSIAMRRSVLAEIGGWHEVKDVLAEDQRLSVALRKLGLRTALGPTSVQNVQRTQRFAQFWGRHTRWAMIRFRVLQPVVLLEPIQNPFVLGLAALAFAPQSVAAWVGMAATGIGSIVITQLSARLTRGYGFKWYQLPLVLVRDVAFLAIWARGATMRWVTWRGNRLQVLAKTRLANPDALARARNIQRLSGEHRFGGKRR